MTTCGVLAVFLWGGASLSAVLGQVPPAPAKPDAAPPAPPKATPEKRPASKGIIGALREQILGSPVMEEAGATDGLIDTLDEADSLFQDAKRRNREALRRLSQQNHHGQVGAARPTQNLVLVIFERLGPQRLNEEAAGAAMPNLRQRATQGATFAQAYAGSSDIDTSCWTLLTGKNTGRLAAGVSTTHDLGSEAALPELLERAGYVTGGVGHWPLSPDPMEAGFDFWSGVAGNKAAVTLYPSEMSLGGAVMRVPGNRDGARASTLWQLLEAETKSWLSARKTSGEPFCLLARLPIPDRDPVPDQVPPETLQAWNHFLGMLTESLEQQGLNSTTCLIVTALTPEASAVAKSAAGLAEGDLRIPLVITGPFLKTSGVQIARPVALWDVLPSCLALAASSRQPTDRDGVPFVALGNKGVSQTDRVLYWRSPEHARDQAVRKGRWKAIYSAKDQRVLLFDLENDPHEAENVAVGHADIVKELLFGAPEAVDATLKKLQR